MGKAKSEECYRYYVSTGFRSSRVMPACREGEAERVVHRILGRLTAQQFLVLDRADRDLVGYRSRLALTEVHETFEAARQEAMRRLSQEVETLTERIKLAQDVLRDLIVAEDPTGTVPTKRTRQKKIH